MLTGLLAVALIAPFVMALALAFLNVGVSAQHPDPTVPDGDPCCGHPDTWGEVALGFVYAAMFLLGAGAVAYLAVQLGPRRLERIVPEVDLEGEGPAKSLQPTPST
jgi:hypothetical protein